MTLDNQNEVENDKALNSYIRAFRCLQQNKNFPENVDQLQEAKTILDIVIPKYKSHHSVITGMKALIATCEKIQTQVQNDTKLAELSEQIKLEYKKFMES